jgi:hypothetical protein
MTSISAYIVSVHRHDISSLGLVLVLLRTVRMDTNMDTMIMALKLGEIKFSTVLSCVTYLELKSDAPTPPDNVL